jgi:NAD(P)-dependent dehydrogenase (short-subunit alcohol dehydrogenase family)
MDLGLKDKVVLCMASAAGLGKGIATEMAREGAKVMICTAEPFKDQLLEAQAEIEKDIGKHIDWDNYDWGDALDAMLTRRRTSRHL